MYKSKMISFSLSQHTTIDHHAITKSYGEGWYPTRIQNGYRMKTISTNQYLLKMFNEMGGVWCDGDGLMHFFKAY